MRIYAAVPSRKTHRQSVPPIFCFKYLKPWINDLCALFLDEVVTAIRKHPYLELLYEPGADEHK